MKKLTNLNADVSNGKLTLTADIVEADDHEFRMPMQQVTVTYINPENMQWPRHCQLSSEAFFIKAFGNGVALRHEDWIDVVSLIEPKTTFAPLLKNQLDDNLTAEVSSEITPDFQWQVSDSIKAAEANWKNIEGQTAKSLDKSTVKTGQFVRLVASSEAGQLISNPVIVK